MSPHSVDERAAESAALESGRWCSCTPPCRAQVYFGDWSCKLCFRLVRDGKRPIQWRRTR